MARVEALAQRLGQSHHVDVPHAGREWAVSTVEHRFTRRDLHADVRIGARRERPPPRDEGNAIRGGGSTGRGELNASPQVRRRRCWSFESHESMTPLQS